MNRFFRSALFPLIVIVLLVYLAGETILGDEPPKREISYAEAQAILREHPERIAEVTLRPRDQEARIELVDGSTAKTSGDQDESSWFSWLPFIAFALLVGLAIFLQNRTRSRAKEDLTAQVRNRSTA
jgi:hypothetical protein